MTAPALPLSLDEVKRNLRYAAGDQDDLLAGFIGAAQDYVERTTGLVLTSRTVTETVQQLGPWIDLASWPVTNVTAIRYPVAGALTPLGSTAWTFSKARRPVRLLPTSLGWGVAAPIYGTPTLPIEIDVAAGYPTTDLVPATVKQAMQLLIAHWWNNRAAAEVGARAAAIEVPFGVAEMLRPHRLVRV